MMRKKSNELKSGKVDLTCEGRVPEVRALCLTALLEVYGSLLSLLKYASRVHKLKAWRLLRLGNYLRDAKRGNLQMSLVKFLLIVCLDLIFVFVNDLETFKNCFVMSY